MKNEDFDFYIDKIVKNISNIYNAFYLWKNLQNSNHNQIYNRYKYFWGITTTSVQLNWLLGIPKLFEESKGCKKDVVSIPFLLKFIPEGEDKEKIRREIENQKPILDNFKKWRNKILAHQDKIVAYNIKDFYKSYPIKGVQVEELLSSIARVIGMIKSTKTNHSEFYSFSLYKENSERNLKGIIEILKKHIEYKRMYYKN
ncbi:MAG: hypothetical protein WC909_01920 [Candidatus Paceibacterota bacterium]|jgi:hypothetical protein